MVCSCVKYCGGILILIAGASIAFFARRSLSSQISQIPIYILVMEGNRILGLMRTDGAVGTRNFNDKDSFSESTGDVESLSDRNSDVDSNAFPDFIWKQNTFNGRGGVAGRPTSCPYNHRRSEKGRFRMKMLDGPLFRDNNASFGGWVKEAGEVLSYHAYRCRRQPNMNCRVESFGRMCKMFDNMRKEWVKEMGFGGLLELEDMHLPRSLCYWLMTRVDPLNEVLIGSDGTELLLTKNSLKWVLGLPNGGKVLPKMSSSVEMKSKVGDLMKRYGKVSVSKSTLTGKARRTMGIPITDSLMSRLECEWGTGDEEEFKILFLLAALDIVLCPTLSARLGSDLVAAATCAMDATSYDWCALVMQKFFQISKAFATRFYYDGFAGGCGGCTIFLVIYYLDHLKRKPLSWGCFPRVKVWNMSHIRRARREDRVGSLGDYGGLGCYDVAYGENHPMHGRDTDGPISEIRCTTNSQDLCPLAESTSKVKPNSMPIHKLCKPRRGAPSDQSPHIRKNENAKRQKRIHPLDSTSDAERNRFIASKLHPQTDDTSITPRVFNNDPLITMFANCCYQMQTGDVTTHGFDYRNILDGSPSYQECGSFSNPHDLTLQGHSLDSRRSSCIDLNKVAPQECDDENF